MKKNIISLLLSILCSYVFAQDIPKETPEDIQIRLLEIKENMTLKLDSCRINRNIGRWTNDYLGGYFLPSEQEKIDSLGLRLNWGMLFDEPMRQRMLQLFRNEYKPEEMQQLLDRWMEIFDKTPLRFKQRATDFIRADTMQIVRNARDSLNRYHREEIDGRLFQTSDAFFALKLDTFPYFRCLVDSLRKAERINKEKEYIIRAMFDMPSLIEASGNVGDKRFVEPLIEILTDLEQGHSKETDKNRISSYKHQIYQVKSALIKMKIEPYRTDFLKQYIRPLEDVKKHTPKDLVGFLGSLAYFGDNQDYLLEMSKYLWSSASTDISVVFGHTGVAYRQAFTFLVRLIQNEDFKQLVGDPKTFDIDNRRFEVYDWMQANYGGYEIKHIW